MKHLYNETQHHSNDCPITIQFHELDLQIDLQSAMKALFLANFFRKSLTVSVEDSPLWK